MATMDPGRWKQVDDLLQAVMGVPFERQGAFLQEACGGDADLVREVQSLLICHQEVNGILERPVLEVAAQEFALRERAEQQERSLSLVGCTMGPYRLIQMLGFGGMGEVWRAEQAEPLRRTVAIKLIKAGMDTRAIVARFASERQALALMDHPNIAKVFEAGETPAGRPYFVMEYVPGLPINHYCDKHRLSIKERLLLFMQVCEGVQHAHHQAIIHRDLKPSNILVADVDGRPMLKIIDFGLAKVIAQRQSETTRFTEVGTMLGTPSYMSPEQADSHERGVDTRTDVYSLGVILYELLAGALPFASREAGAAGDEAMLQKMRTDVARRPSAKVRSLGEDAKDVATKRQEEPQSLARHLNGELDWITLKALEKDRNRRYGSPAELATDLQRYIHHEPVAAGPPGASYRARKFIRRHRFGATVAAIAAFLLIAFAATMAFQARRIARERDRANREAETSKRVSEFMTNMFRVSDPNEARGNSITVREMLDKTAKQIDPGLNHDPELQANLMDTMGIVYTRLGLLKTARPLLERSVDVRRRVLGENDAATLHSQNHLAWLLYQEGNFTEAENLYRATLNAQKHVLGTEHPDTLMSMDGLASTLDDDGQHSEAETLERQTLEIRRRLLGSENLQTLDAMSNLAGILSNEGKREEADKLLGETIEVGTRVLGPRAPTILWAMNNLAADFHLQRRYEEAEKLYRETIERERVVFGPEHPTTLMAMSDLSETLRKEGRYAEAEKLQREALKVQRRVLGPQQRGLADSIYNLGCLAALQNRHDEALLLIREAIDRGLDADTDLQIEKEADLASLRGDRRFDTLVSRAKARALATQKAH
jgi:serine/threonine protein kinase